MPEAPGPHAAPPEPGSPKSAWRDWARRERAARDPVTSGLALSRSLEHWPAYRAAHRILTYLAFGDEPDMSPLLDDQSKAFYVTRTPPGPSRELTVHRLEPEELERHPFGYLQPASTASPASTFEIDLVIVPGLAFDLRGNRLGFGMGYYDRLLDRLSPHVLRVGVTAATLLVPELPREPHDVRMTHVATEDGVFEAAGPD